MLEFFYDQGLRTGDLILVTGDFPFVQLQISDLDSNEPLITLLDYSLNILSPLSDNLEPF